MWRGHARVPTLGCLRPPCVVLWAEGLSRPALHLGGFWNNRGQGSRGRQAGAPRSVRGRRVHSCHLPGGNLMVLLQQQQSVVPKVTGMETEQKCFPPRPLDVTPPKAVGRRPFGATVSPDEKRSRGSSRQAGMAGPSKPSPLGSAPGGTRGFLSLLGGKGELRKEAQGPGICNIRAKFSPRIETRRIRDVSQAL